MKKILLFGFMCTVMLFACKKSSMDDFEILKTKAAGGGSSSTNNSSSSPRGIWNRFGSPNGYMTDLAIGNIPGEPSNRVYMCEHPNSPSVGLYKGLISGNTITWDAVHRLPNAEFAKDKNGGSYYRLWFSVAAYDQAGKYNTGSWTGTCPM